MERVYIETTFVNYLTARPNRDMVIAGHQQITHEWWEIRRTSYELCLSQLVLDEAAVGDVRAARERLEVLKSMTVPESALAAGLNWPRRAARGIFEHHERPRKWDTPMVSPVLEQQLHEQLNHLPAGQQRQVLDFARALAASRPRGVPGRDLLPLAGTIGADDQAVADCEQVDAHGW